MEEGACLSTVAHGFDGWFWMIEYIICDFSATKNDLISNKTRKTDTPLSVLILVSPKLPFLLLNETETWKCAKEFARGER